MSATRVARATMLLLGLCVVGGGLACDDDPPLAPGALRVTPVPDTLLFPAGTTAHLTVTIERGVRYDRPVTLGAEGLPRGVTVQAALVSAADTTGTLAFTADTSAAGESANVTITATPDAREGRATAGLSLSVGEPLSFAFTVDRDTVLLEPGVPDTTRVSITRGGGFAGAVVFAVGGLPAGLSSDFVQDTVPGDTARLAFLADSTAATDTTWLLTLTASAEGLLPRVDSLPVRVLEPDSGAVGGAR
jgi:hypothetical protein